MSNKEIIKYLKNSIDDKGNYSYSLPAETTKETIKCIEKQEQEISRLNKFVDDILNFYEHNRYEEELTEDNMFKLVLNQNEMIMTIEEFKGDANVH